MIWTIEYNGTEQTVADWGLAQLTLNRLSQGTDLLTFRADGAAADAAPVFPFKSTIILRRDRTQESGGLWSGGTQWFIGLIIQVPRNGASEAEGMNYKVAGPWWYLDSLLFQQEYQQFNGWKVPGDPTSDPTFIDSETDTHLFLNLAPLNTITPNGKITSGQQIAEALNWVRKPFVDAGQTPPLQVGTITPNLDVPIDEVRDITCAEVIHKMLRWTPDAVTWFDYSTTPPTFNCKRRSELNAVTLDITSDAYHYGGS
jgi:hypothetical protein